MIYVISEDEGSGLSFWKIFFESYFKEYQIITSNSNAGNLTLQYQLDEALSRTSANDTIFIAFDKIYSSSGFDTGDFLNVAMEKCRRKSVDLYVTKYFCFEEIYLSYPELETMIRKDGRDLSLANVALYIREMIEKDEDYFQSNKQVREQIESKRKDASQNREHFADAALYNLTRTIKHGYFTIDKSKRNGINKCWTSACDDIRNTKKKDISYMCDNCSYSQKDASRIDKLNDLCKKSCLVDNSDSEPIDLFGINLTTLF